MTAVVPAWTASGLCAQTDPAEFYPAPSSQARTAKNVCLACDVRRECLNYALTNREQYGVWGGLSERERRRLTTHTTTTAPGGAA